MTGSNGQPQPPSAATLAEPAPKRAEPALGWGMAICSKTELEVETCSHCLRPSSHRRVVDVDESFVKERDVEWERHDYVTTRGLVSREESDELTMEVEDSAPEFIDTDDLMRFTGLRLSAKTLKKGA